MNMTKKKIEKVWLFGQMREYDESSYEKALSNDIEDYFKGKFDQPIPVKVYRIDNYLSINIGLGCGVKCSDDTIPQSIAGILFGITKDYKPEHCFAMCPDFGYMNVSIEKEDFIDNYKKNVKYYGATPVKSVEIETIDDYGFIVRLIY